MTTDPGEANRLLLDVARCELVEGWLERGEPTKCSSIIDAQWPAGTPPEAKARLWRERHLVPEPWSGLIEQAPILFVASNPSTGGAMVSTEPTDHMRSARGQYPVADTAPAETESYFTNRFRDWIEDGVRIPNTARDIPFWRDVKAIASEICPDVRPGIDYALTEIVRCKSVSDATGEVQPAASTCAQRYIERTIALSPATVIVSVGRFAKSYFWGWPAKGAAFPVTEAVVIGGVERVVLHVSHPANRTGQPWLPSVVAPEHLEMLRARVAGARPHLAH
jgi:hypothetical protein